MRLHLTTVSYFKCRMDIISRKDAIEKGLSRYYTGKPCSNGHYAERSVSSRACCICRLNSTNAYQNRRSKESLEFKESMKASSRIRSSRLSKNNPDKRSASQIRRRAARKGALLPDRSPECDLRERVLAIEVRKLSEETGKTYHCDHIIALNGRCDDGSKIFGPHVIWNLRPFLASENLEKSNKVTEDNIQEALENLRALGAKEDYVFAVERNLREGKKPCDWLLPEW